MKENEYPKKIFRYTKYFLTFLPGKKDKV